MTNAIISLRDRFRKSLEGFGKPIAVAPEAFNNALEQLVKNALIAGALNTSNAIAILTTDHGRAQPLEETLPNTPFAEILSQTRDVSRIYTQGHKRFVDVDNARSQDSWANIRDHVRTLIFRTITTAMIAGSVLGTGYLAKKWEIPLPMLNRIVAQP